MSYSYQTQRAEVFTEEGQRLFLAIRDRVHSLLKDAGAIRFQEATSRCLKDSGLGACDSWMQLACIDRLVELGEIREIPQDNCTGQHRVFVSAKST